MIIGLIACCAKKNSFKTTASNMYQSTLFKYSFRYLNKRCDKVFILSAKYGFLEPKQEIEPYDITLNKMTVKQRLIWSKAVIKDLSKCCDLNKDKFIILTGIKYRENIIPHINHYEIPMVGLGIGKQLKFLKEDEVNE